jgi:hypothetical protein
LLNGNSAKYIEGLENRLGRMEALLRLSGLLSDQDADSTDLQTLERRLAKKNAQLTKDREREGQNDHDSNSSATTPNASVTPSIEVTATDDNSNNEKTPHGSKAEKAKPKEREVEALSEAMCSLVTNNYGDTRYIGMQLAR